MSLAASSKRASFFIVERSWPDLLSPSATYSGSSYAWPSLSWRAMCCTIFSVSGVSIKAHCIRTSSLPWKKSISPRPIRLWALGLLRIVLESIPEATLKAIRAGKLALIRPVTTSVEGRCVARTIWIPAARAFWAKRAIGCSASRPAVIIRSDHSSTISTI